MPGTGRGHNAWLLHDDGRAATNSGHGCGGQAVLQPVVGTARAGYAVADTKQFGDDSESAASNSADADGGRTRA